MMNRKNKVTSDSIKDKLVTFQEEGHIYRVRGDSSYISSTTFVHTFFKEFDAYTISLKKAKRMYPLRSYKDQLLEAQKFRDQWDLIRDDACLKGTQMHETIEDYYNGKEIEHSKQTKEFLSFLEFDQYFKELQYHPYRSEWRVFDDEFKIVGSIDQLFFSDVLPENELIMVDWKRSKNISTFSYNKQKGMGVLFYLNDCNYIHYALQQNIYKYILEKNYNVKIKEMYLLHINPSNYKRNLIKLPDMQNEVKNMLLYRRAFDLTN